MLNKMSKREQKMNSTEFIQGKKQLTIMRDKNTGVITEHQYQQELQKIERDQRVKDRL